MISVRTIRGSVVVPSGLIGNAHSATPETWPRRGRARSDQAEYARPRQSVIARAVALTVLAMIAAAIGAGLGYAMLALMAAAS